MIFKTILGVALIATLVQDGPRVSARLSTTSAAVGETVVLEIAVQGAGPDVSIGAPRFPAGLVLIGTQDFTEMNISFPGGRTQTRRREYALQAATPGRFRIAPVTVNVGNKSYRTNTLELVVTGASLPRSIESSDDAWLRAWMEPDTVYVGQQSTLTVEAGFSEEVRVRLTRPPTFETPSPTGFWIQDVPGGVQSRLRSVNGRVVEMQTVQRAYFPLSAGRFAFAAARAVIDVREGFLFAPETREIRSESPKLTVLPLPDAGRPPEFRGAVGRYEIRAFVQPDTVAVGEAAQVTFELTGIGNIKGAPQPVLPAIAGVEQFAPTEDATVSFEGATVRGVKQFQWVVIPSHAGVIQVPSATYAYFDPVAREYRTLTTAPMSLVVVASSAGDESDASAATALRALRERPAHAALGWVRTRWFLIGQLIPLLAIMLALLVMYLRETRSRSPSLLSDLKRVRDANAPYPDFLRDLEVVLRGALRRSDALPDVRVRLMTLIDRIEAQRFAPAAAEAEERQSLLREAEALVRAVLKNESSAGRSAILLIFALLQAPAAGSFQRGSELYRSGQFAEAAQAFEAVVAQDSADISAWVNLGNSHYRAGQQGRAIWAWARASREAPRDGAIVRNLQSVGAVEILRTRPPLSVRPVEWYFLAAIAWWVACGILILAIVRRRAQLLSWALPAVAVLVVALIVGAFADGRDYAVALQEQTQLFGDPTVHSPVVRRVQAGAGLDVLERRSDWLRVRTVTGAEGWVESDAVGRL